MGTCYTYLLYDEFDWVYNEISKEDVIDHIKIDMPVAEILATWPHYIVVDLDKNSPWGDTAQRLKGRCDKAYYYTDSDSSEIQEVEFKETEQEKQVIANKPANRNQQYIDEAYTEWTKNYYHPTENRQHLGTITIS